MPTETIYGPQTWAAGTFAYPGFYRSTAVGGSDSPNADYDELVEAEGVKTEDSGPGGARVLTLDDSTVSEWVDAGIVLMFSELTGPEDMRGPVYCEWDTTLLAENIEADLFPRLVTLAAAGGLASSARFLDIVLEQTTGANFTYNLSYRKPDGGGTTMVSAANTANDTADDAEHNFILEVTPSTVTGAYVGNGTLGSATIDTDGRIRFWVDDALIYDVTGLQLLINYFATTNPAVYEATAVWHGHDSMAGPTRNTHLYRLTETIESERNFLTGFTHTVTGRDNLIAGDQGTVTGDRVALFNMKEEDPGEYTGSNAFIVNADTILFNGEPPGAGGGGASALDDLTDVVITDPQTGDVLAYDGADWINTPAGTWLDDDGAAQFNGQYYSPEHDAGLSGTSKTIDWDDGNTQGVEMDDDCEFTLNNPRAGGRYLLIIDNTGAHAITWPGSVQWSGGTPPDLDTAGLHIVTLVYSTLAGGAYLAAANLDFS